MSRWSPYRTARRNPKAPNRFRHSRSVRSIPFNPFTAYTSAESALAAYASRLGDLVREAVEVVERFEAVPRSSRLTMDDMHDYAEIAANRALLNELCRLDPTLENEPAVAEVRAALDEAATSYEPFYTKHLYD